MLMTTDSNYDSWTILLKQSQVWQKVGHTPILFCRRASRTSRRGYSKQEPPKWYRGINKDGACQQGKVFILLSMFLKSATGIIRTEFTHVFSPSRFQWDGPVQDEVH